MKVVEIEEVGEVEWEEAEREALKERSGRMKERQMKKRKTDYDDLTLKEQPQMLSVDSKPWNVGSKVKKNLQFLVSPSLLLLRLFWEVL